MYMGYFFSYEGVYVHGVLLQLRGGVCTRGVSSVMRGCMYMGYFFSYEGVYVHGVRLQL